MQIKNLTGQGKSYFIADKRIVFQPNQIKEVSDSIGSFLLSEYSSELCKVGYQTEQLIIDEPVIQENQSLLTETKKVRKNK